MKLIINLLLISILFSSCDKEVVLSGRERKVVNQLAKATYIVSSSPKDEKLYQYISDSLTTEKLVFLTNHKSPNVRCHAFSSLAKKNYQEIQDLFYEHENDSVDVVTLRGVCGNLSMKVNRYMLWDLHPDNNCKYRFGKREFDLICKKHNMN